MASLVRIGPKSLLLPFADLCPRGQYRLHVSSSVSIKARQVCFPVKVLRAGAGAPLASELSERKGTLSRGLQLPQAGAPCPVSATDAASHGLSVLQQRP